MPRGARRTNNNPESGYKFDCQWCEGEVFQAAQPQLCWLIEEMGSGRNRQIASSSFQCCTECAEEVGELNAQWHRENPTPAKQSRPLRDAETLAATLPDAAKQQATTSSSTDAKLDKLIDCMSTMMQMMVMQVQQNMPQPAAPIGRDEFIKEMESTLRTYTPPKPKRAILAPPAKKVAAKKPVKKNATSAPKKPQKRTQSKTAKRKR